MPMQRAIDSLEVGEVLELTIDDYGFTGEGFVRLEDGWLSVRGAMPGERVRVHVDEPPARTSRRRWATLLAVMHPSPERRPPLCDRDASCRGCQLRHLSVQEESRYKARTIAEVLTRYTHIPAEELPPIQLIVPQPWMRGDAHRIRTSLTYRRLDGAHFELGLVANPAMPLIPMSECAALIRPVRRMIERLEQALGELSRSAHGLPAHAQGEGEDAPLLGVRIAAPAHGRGFIDLRVGPGNLERIHRLDELLEESLPEQVSRFISAPQATLHTGGPDRMRLPIGDLQLEVSPHDWFHATLAPAHVLYMHVMQELAPTPQERFLDIGCGTGALALLAAQAGAHSVGIDANIVSIESAELNALNLELERANFEPGSWEAALRRLVMRGERFDVATINPMREPLGERALAYLEPLGIKRLMYLGPSPVSTARDLAHLRSMGWELEALAGAMLHPATYHVMLVAKLVRA